ncbi:hypothetical protein PAPHI01_2638 [Pancytospora philotis]|nr:hypothetical protein PAPHI01_2638 [Pancytospora philotis]
MACSVLAVLLHLVWYASASTPSPDIEGNALPTVEERPGDDRELSSGELLQVRERIVEFFESAAAQALNTCKNTAECFQRILSTDFTSVEDACACVLAGLANDSRLYLRLMKHYREDTTTRHAIHKFFACGLSIWHANTELMHGAAFGVFMRRVAHIPARVSNLDYTACIKRYKLPKEQLVALMLAKANWRATAVENEVHLVIDILKSYRPWREFHLILAVGVVQILYQLGFLEDKDICTGIFSKLLVFTYECRRLENARFFKRFCFDDRATDSIRDALLDLWCAGSIQWDHKPMPSVRASTKLSYRMNLSDFCYNHRSLLSEKGARVVSLILSEYKLCKVGQAKEPNLTSWPAPSRDVNILSPKLIYTVYYLGQRGLFLILDPAFQHFFDMLGDKNLVWLMHYLSKEPDTTVRASIDDSLHSLTYERRERLYQWAEQFLNSQWNTPDTVSTSYKIVQDVHYKLESHPYFFGDQPELKKRRK